jgi:hypothetical protein
MCTGEVEMKVWMRDCFAGLTASPALGDLVDGGEIAFGGDRKAGLDDVDAHGVEELGDFELLFVGHGGAGALLAVAQGGVEDDDAVLLGLGRCRFGRL